MSLGLLLDDIRRHYTARLASFAEELRAADPDATVLTEVAFEDEDGAVAVEGVLELPMRLDVVELKGGDVSQLLTVDTDSHVDFEPVDFDWGEEGLPVALGPFAWNRLRIRLHGLGDSPDWTPLQDWFWIWFTRNEPSEGGFLGAVHFLSDPEPMEAGAYQFTADLGTAPVSAFEDLLDTFSALGTSEAEIGGANGEPGGAEAEAGGSA